MHERTRTAALRQPHPSHDILDDDATRGAPPPGLALDPPEAPPPAHPPEIPVERLDPEALKVIARLRHMHHQAYLVGGCVRDLLLGQTPKDFDVATDAHPGEVRAIFRNCRLIGRRFRLAHVYFRGGKVIEVATFRKNPGELAAEEGAADGEADLLITRDNVFGTAEEDAVRRDFTVNGLFYDVAAGEVIDYVGGRADLEARRIHTIGDPEIRIREDPVRSLRAVRFASRLGFTIAPDTFEAMRRSAGELARCAPARVLEETFKILRCGGSARAFQLLRACGALPFLLPALGTALDSWDEAGRRSFFAHLAALDGLVRSGAEVSEAVLLAALVMHLGVAPGPAPEGDASTGREADELLASLVSTSRLPRKVAERVRLALHAQRHFREPPRGRRARKMVNHSYFVDALALLELSVRATGAGAELLEQWRALRTDGHGEHGDRHGLRHDEEREPAPRARGRREADAPEPAQAERTEATEPGEAGPALEVVAEAPAADGEGEPGRKRRRRRGGRRRRRRGAGGGSSAGSAGPGPQAAGGPA
ncbi:MAG TPA: polynucleotide adenylyltransferase PcnB [Anaeromyxobacter sp.]|nr:polynucleotide adenylyltransferase PcnB [Anaeromyxobacter sp.]